MCAVPSTRDRRGNVGRLGADGDADDSGEHRGRRGVATIPDPMDFTLRSLT
jgi:hypothetical protein